MRPARACRPEAGPLEGRIALSFSLSHLIHTLLPFIPDSTAAKPYKIHAAGHPALAARHPHAAAARQLAAHRLAAAARPASVH